MVTTEFQLKRLILFSDEITVMKYKVLDNDVLELTIRVNKGYVN